MEIKKSFGFEEFLLNKEICGSEKRIIMGGLSLTS